MSKASAALMVETQLDQVLNSRPWIRSSEHESLCTFPRCGHGSTLAKHTFVQAISLVAAETG